MEGVSCKYCGEIFVAKSIGGHTRMCDLNPKRQENLRKLESTRQAITNDSRMKMRESLKEAWKRGDYDGVAEKLKERPRKKMSAQARLNMSVSRRRWLTENPDKHQWKLQKARHNSYPCEKFKDELRSKSIEFVEEYQPLDDRFFSIDIAFPSIKVGIEINGGQHYDIDGNLKKYYQDRHDLIESAGWKIYEIPHRACYHSEKLSEIVEAISSTHDLSSVDWTNFIPQETKKQRAARVEHQKNLEKEKRAAAVRCKKDELRNAWGVAIQKVDVTKHGFVAKLAFLMNCTHTHVRRVLRRDFPELITFQRNSINK